MESLSYGLSPLLKEQLAIIDDVRKKILLVPLALKQELKFRFEAKINRIYWSLLLSGGDQTKVQVTKLCIGGRIKRLGARQLDVLKYKKALDYIAFDWYVSQRSVLAKTITNLHDIASAGRLKIAEKHMKFLSDYLSASSDHPVIQAGIAHILLEQTRPFTQGNSRTARLLTYLFLYKFGFDFRGLLVLEEYFGHDKNGYQSSIENVRNTGKATLWLEYFTKAMIVQLEKSLATISTLTARLDIPSLLFELNERQKTVLATLEDPSAKITNKNLQKMFKISQITASRDLAKLSTLGLLIPRGKGRSVYYTRV